VPGRCPVDAEAVRNADIADAVDAARWQVGTIA
jgi:hypothetical protein